MNRTIAVSIDQLSRPQPGGIASYVRGLLRGLAEVSHETTVTAIGTRRAIDALGEREPGFVAPLGSLAPRLWRWHPVGVPSGCDVVHATSMMGPFGGAERVQSAALHDLLWRDEPHASTKRGIAFHEQRLQLLLQHASIRLLTTSPLLPPRLQALGVDPARIFPVRLGVDNAGVTPASPATVQTFLAEAGVHGPFTLHAGTREPRKNTWRLVQAHAEVRAEHREVGPLVFAGPPGWGAAPTGDAIVLGMVPRELLLGLYRDATVVAYVPLAEGFGLPPVEALRAGSRVVASQNCPSVAGNLEVVAVDPNDVHDIATGLLAASHLRDDEYARLRRTESVAAFTWQNCARDHLAAWA